MNKPFTAREVRDAARNYNGDTAAPLDVLRAFADMLEAREKAVPVAEVCHGANVVTPFGKDGARIEVRWLKGANPKVGEKLYTHPSPHKGATHCDNCGCTWLDDGNNPIGCPYCKPSSADADQKVTQKCLAPPCIGNGVCAFEYRKVVTDAEMLAEALERTARHRAAADRIDPDQWRSVLYSWEDRALAAHSAQAQPPAASVTDAMVERGLEACIQDSDARLSRYKVVRSIIEAALAAQENPNGV